MTIRFPGRFNLGLIAKAGGVTDVLHQVFFNATPRPELVVSDGRMMAVIPVDIVPGVNNSAQARVSGEAWKLATSNMRASDERHLTIQEGVVAVKDDQGRHIMTVQSGDPADGSKGGIPADYRKVIPPPKSQHIAVALDPRSLLTMARVLGAREKLVLHMDAKPDSGVVHTPIRVSAEPWGPDAQPHGVLMPIMIEKDRHDQPLVLRGRAAVAVKKGKKK
jgi:hypothetical protein